MKRYLSFIIILTLMISCAGSGELVREEDPDSLSDRPEEILTGDTEDQIFFSERVQLADRWYNMENTVPEAFQEIPVQREVERDPFQGYRIQIYSSQDVIGADTVAAGFRAWADTTIANYVPETYVFFKTPYYRVHVGDFYDRERAYRFSNVVKRAFRGAWVVYDRVEPNRILPDTMNIMLIEADTLRAIR